MDMSIVVLILQILIMGLQAILVYLQNKNAMNLRILAERLGN